MSGQRSRWSLRGQGGTGGLHRFPMYKSLLGKRERRAPWLYLSLASSVSLFYGVGVESSKSIYDSMCSVFKCNLRKKIRKMKTKKVMEFDSCLIYSDDEMWRGYCVIIGPVPRPSAYGPTPPHWQDPELERAPGASQT